MARKALDSLTDNEVRALYYSVYQPHLVRGNLKTALRSAADKLDNELCNRRRDAIYLHGRRDGFAGRPYKAVFDGRQLGSMEGMTYGRGFEAGQEKRRNRACSEHT